MIRDEHKTKSGQNNIQQNKTVKKDTNYNIDCIFHSTQGQNQ